MGFNIGGLLGGIGDLVGTVFGGSAGGQLLGGGLKIASQALTPAGSPPGRATTPAQTVQQARPGTETVPVSVASLGRPFSPAPFRAPSNRFGGRPNLQLALGGKAVTAGVGLGAMALEGVSGMFGGSASPISDILKEARSNVKGATKNKIIAAAKTCGIELAAETYGLDEKQVCILIVHGRTRRSRGISGADIRRARRVIRFNKRLTKDLKVR